MPRNNNTSRGGHTAHGRARSETAQAHRARSRTRAPHPTRGRAGTTWAGSLLPWHLPTAVMPAGPAMPPGLGPCHPAAGGCLKTTESPLGGLQVRGVGPSGFTTGRGVPATHGHSSVRVTCYITRVAPAALTHSRPHRSSPGGERLQGHPAGHQPRPVSPQHDHSVFLGGSAPHSPPVLRSSGAAVSLLAAGASPTDTLLLQIAPRDALGNPITDDLQNSFSMLARPINAAAAAPTIQLLPSDLLWQPSTQLYTARNLTLTAAGPHTIDIQHAFTPIQGSPFSITILPGPASAARSSVGGPGWHGPLTAGAKARVTVRAFDAWGNPADSSADRFWLQWSDRKLGGAGARSEVMGGSGAGMYAAEYDVATAGIGSVGLTVWLYGAQGTQEVVATTEVSVLPAAVSPEACFLTPLSTLGFTPTAEGLQGTAGVLPESRVVPAQPVSAVWLDAVSDAIVVAASPQPLHFLLQDKYGNLVDMPAEPPPVATLSLPGASATVKALKAPGLWQLSLSFSPLLLLSPTVGIPGSMLGLYLPCSVRLQRDGVNFGSLALQISLLQPDDAAADPLAVSVTRVLPQQHSRGGGAAVVAGVQSYFLATLANATAGGSGLLAAPPKRNITLVSTPALGVAASTDFLGPTSYLLALNATTAGSYSITLAASAHQLTAFELGGQALAFQSEPVEGAASATHKLSLTPTAVGNYALSILANGQPVGSNADPIILQVHPGSCDLAATMLTGYSSSVIAGQPAAAHFRTFDSFGNLYTAPDIAHITVVGRDQYGNVYVAEPIVGLSASDAVASTSLTASTAEVSYSTAHAGPLVLSINMTTPSGSAPILGAPFHPWVDMESAPKLLSAQMTANLAGMTLAFDQATNQAGASTDWDCGRTLAQSTVAKLGAGAFCRFTSPTALEATFGSAATIMPAGTVTPDLVQLSGSNAISSASGTSYNASGGVVLLPPVTGTTQAPLAVINAPAQVGACEEVFVDACQSAGSGGRPLTFSFSIHSPLLLPTPALLQELPWATKRCSFTLSRGALAPGTSVQIGVTVQNFMGLVESAEVSITMLNATAPTVRIPGGDCTVLRSWTVVLRGVADYPSPFLYNASSQLCQATDASGPDVLGFEWSADPVGPLFNFDDLSASCENTQQSTQLAIPPNMLKAGQTYTFYLTASLRTHPSVAATAYVHVMVEASPITLSLPASAMVRSAEQSITIQAIAADPDNATDILGELLTFQYAWSAMGPGNVPLPYPQSLQLFTDAALQDGTVSFPSHGLGVGTYTFSVKAESCPHIQSRPLVTVSMTVTVVAEPVAAVAVQLLGRGDPTNFPATLALTLQCIIEGGNGAGSSLHWAVQANAGLDDLSSIASFPAPHLLYIAPGQLMAASQYQFTCSGGPTLSDTSGQATLALATAPVPTSGVLHVRLEEPSAATPPYDAVAALDAFMLTAQDWVGQPERQLQYEFRALQVTGAEQRELPLAAPTVANWLQALLPPGNISVVVYVSSASHRATGQWAALARSNTDDSRGQGHASDLLLAAFEEVVANGDVASALQLGSIFGQTFTSRAAGTTADYCSQNDTVAAAREQIITQLSDLDDTAYPSTAYLLQSSCAIADLAGAPADLTLGAAVAVAAFLSAHVDLVLGNEQQGYISPLPGGDPFLCFARGTNSVLERLNAQCVDDTDAALGTVSVAALQSMANLGLAVASMQPLGSLPWTYAFPFYSIQALRSTSSVKATAGGIAGAFTGSPASAQLQFTLPQEIAEGAIFEARRWEMMETDSAAAAGAFMLGRRLLQQSAASQQSLVGLPVVLDHHTVSVNVTQLGAFFYLVGGQAPPRAEPPKGSTPLSTAGKAAVSVVAVIVGLLCSVGATALASRVAVVRARLRAMVVHPAPVNAPDLARRSVPVPRCQAPSLPQPLTRSASAPLPPSPSWADLISAELISANSGMRELM
ncbi:hypothetical protein WJX73_007598 [Symbiochloris irregularis]|uniref:PKD/REJ-like domain-containing protein n=1 Tax=Symbiochloris irregularis TaxID=706552 RepID=A0AAW1NM45_9CHLO